MKTTDLLLEVDTWTGFTGHFTHLKSGDAAKDRIPLLTAILISQTTGLAFGEMGSRAGCRAHPRWRGYWCSACPYCVRWLARSGAMLVGARDGGIDHGILVVDVLEIS